MFGVLTLQPQPCWAQTYHDPEYLMMARSAAALYERCEGDRRRRRVMPSDEVMEMNLDQQILAQLASQAVVLRDVLAREAAILAVLQQVKSQVDKLVEASEPPVMSISSSMADGYDT